MSLAWKAVHFGFPRPRHGHSCFHYGSPSSTSFLLLWGGNTSLFDDVFLCSTGMNFMNFSNYEFFFHSDLVVDSTI